MATGGAIEPIAAIFALGVRQALLLFALGTLPVHLAIGNIVFKDQAALRANLGITTVIRRLTTRRRADKHRMTGIAPILAARHLFTNRTFFHQDTSININSGVSW